MNSLFVSILTHCRRYVYNGRWPIRLNLKQYIREHLRGHPSEDQLLRELEAISDEQIELEWKKINESTTT